MVRRGPAGDAARQISMLFDVFVLNQHLRELLTRTLAATGMRPDEYAVYSLLFEAGPLTPTDMAKQMGMPITTVLDYLRPMFTEGHARRGRHPDDGRSYLVSLTRRGLAAFQRANVAWNVGVRRLEGELSMSVAEVRRALAALDAATVAALDGMAEELAGRGA